MDAQLAYVHTEPAREAKPHRTDRPLDPALRAKLAEAGIEELYAHQAFAYDAVMRGEDVAIATGTNSGKSLCYHLPALELVLAEPAARALYLFPTKALAQDQAAKLAALAPGAHVRIGLYDGDTPVSRRSAVRKLAHVVVTNPDMLHAGILPNHESWSSFLKSLRLIVVDEMHAYRGVFGAHVSGVLRRLLRLCAWHHARPQIVACSATVANPDELFERLTGRHARVIELDGSPAGERTTLLWNPPVLPSGDRLSGNLVTAELLAGFVREGIRALAFSRSRVGAELVLQYARASLAESGGPVGAVESYRAGYTPKERRTIEADLFSGKLLGLSATSAMELGVDVGGLDVAILNGYPGSISSFRQQAGRAGRGRREALAILVTRNEPLEQYLARFPGEIFQRSPETVTVTPGNPTILAAQLKCAAYERGLAPTELDAYGNGALEVAESLDLSGELAFRAGRFFYPSHQSPARAVSIRGGGGEAVRLELDGELIGTMERRRAVTSAHAGAIYLHRGVAYMVDELDLDRGLARLRRADVSYYTTPVIQSVIETGVRIRQSGAAGHEAALCGVKVTEAVQGFRRKSLDGGSLAGGEAPIEPLDLPPETYETVALRLDFPFGVETLAEMGGLHAAEHALVALAPLFAGCDRADLGSAWYTVFADSLLPAIFVFDREPGGVGLCEALYRRRSDLVEAAAALLERCACGGGCPACMLSAHCECGNEPLDKGRAIGVLRAFGAGLKDEA